ncbi:DUF262 domain-containing protein [Clostridium botulinum]|uniref:DUF262 domain-containing protein n=1 Tax=Clostridium botulinum TaxID=1491 RepID=UPI00052D2CA5|nr:DUF262 domain-containing protein [Clostridium botulinum]KGM92925.1 hypothetical protein Z956_13035 [Clostridium botulinum D str. CCUG 7971]KOC49946.1 hypothetical protein ADU88_04405 [Clostridium botulinum]MCD3351590.1 DUF262 domain-containing protein [Clostridium botulinum D/C]MCD3360535.1 DUF262 domain-containing protein [Clostridium botulinum D/C]MCD3362207.1 DUF262 domain-containing protein [Clostridium botulinum D/C]
MGDTNKLFNTCAATESDSIENHTQNELLDEHEDEKEIDITKLFDTTISKNMISMDFQTLMTKFNKFDFSLPRYQRKYVWNKKQIAKLALSLIKNLPIPPIYVYRDSESNRQIILDGQQRMISLFLYYNDLVLKNNNHRELVDFYKILKEDNRKDKSNDLTLFSLISNEKAFKKTKYTVGEGDNEFDITFGNLDIPLRRQLESSYIDVVFIDVKGKDKETVYSNIFNLLNDAGTPLERQEIRNGVYACPFYDMLHDFNENSVEWRNFYGRKHDRSKDIEILLRFVAMNDATEFCDNEIKFKTDKDGNQIYKGSYNLLLDDYSQRSLKFSKDEIEKINTDLEEFLSKIKLSNKLNTCMIKNKKVSHVLIEALYIAYMKSDRSLMVIDDFLIEKILTSAEYPRGTSSKEIIEDRLNFVFNIIKQLRLF